jgi:hypothetical protein
MSKFVSIVVVNRLLGINFESYPLALFTYARPFQQHILLTCTVHDLVSELFQVTHQELLQVTHTELLQVTHQELLQVTHKELLRINFESYPLALFTYARPFQQHILLTCTVHDLVLFSSFI